jgi:hypothetical protein
VRAPKVSCPDPVSHTAVLSHRRWKAQPVDPRSLHPILGSLHFSHWIPTPPLSSSPAQQLKSDT